MNEIYTLSREEMVRRGTVPLEVLASAAAVYERMAQDVIDEVRRNNERSRRTLLVLPVGPIEQYEILVRKVNAERLSLRDVTVLNMDEYMVSETEYIPKDHTLSFRGFMERAVYRKIDPDLAVPEANRCFPEPGAVHRVGFVIV